MMKILLAAAIAACIAPAVLAEGHVLFYPTVLRGAKNLFEDGAWRRPSLPHEKGSESSVVQGGPFSEKAPAWKVVSFEPESAYWRQHVKVMRGRTYLLGAWVKYSNAKILFWNYGKQATDGRRWDQRLYCFGGFNDYLTPYLSPRLRDKLGGDPAAWKLCFRTLTFPEPLDGDQLCCAIGLYMATGEMTFSSPFLVDVTDLADMSLTVDIAGARPIRALTIEHVGVRDTIWRRDFAKPVTDFCEAVPSVTNYARGMEGDVNKIEGHALNVYYADGTSGVVFAPQENVFKYR